MEPTTKETFGRRVCWNCQTDPGGDLFCSHCSKIQPLADGKDLFGLLGYPRRLGLDSQDVERRYHGLSRRFHPDFYQTRSPREQALSLAISAALNAAYQTLRDPLKRAEYLLRLEGVNVEHRRKQIPPWLSDALFQTQEVLWRLKSNPKDVEALTQVREAQAQFGAFHAQAEARLDQHAGAWDRYVEQALRGEEPSQDRRQILEALAGSVSEMAYLKTILRDLEQALEAPALPEGGGSA